MGLADVQRALARLSTEAELLGRFVAAPQKVGEELGLGDADIQQLTQISHSKLEQFASSLRSKRRNEVTKLLPQTCRILDDSLISLFARHAEIYTPGGVKKHLDDALAFAAFLERSQYEAGFPDWLPDIVRYETAWLMAGSSPRCLILRRFRFNITALLLSTLAENAQPASVRPAMTIIMWYRLNPQSSIRQRVFSTAALLITDVTQ